MRLDLETPFRCEDYDCEGDPYYGYGKMEVVDSYFELRAGREYDSSIDGPRYLYFVLELMCLDCKIERCEKFEIITR